MNTKFDCKLKRVHTALSIFCEIERYSADQNYKLDDNDRDQKFSFETEKSNLSVYQRYWVWAWAKISTQFTEVGFAFNSDEGQGLPPFAKQFLFYFLLARLVISSVDTYQQKEQYLYSKLNESTFARFKLQRAFQRRRQRRPQSCSPALRHIGHSMTET
jgi:hypothetical protein